MHTIKFLVIFSLSLIVIIPLSKNIFLALKTGYIRHTDTVKKCSRKNSPTKFWTLLLLNIFFLIAILFAIIQSNIIIFSD